MKNVRNSNIELLRIFSMLLIILYHIIRRNVDYEGSFSTLPVHTYLTETFLGIWGLLGVDIFIAISAWFLCTSRFHLKHIISIVFQTFCYIAVFRVIEAAINYDGIISVIKYSLIGIHDTYLFKNGHWFVGPYIMMCFMAPFINLLVEKFSKRELETLLCVFTGVFVYANLSNAFFKSSTMFIYIYLICAYLKKYRTEKRPYLLWGGVLVMIITMFCMLNDNSSTNGLIGFINNYTSKLLGQYKGLSLIIAFTAICFLMSAVQAVEKHSRVINTLGGLTFGVYLFHETYIYIGDNSLALTDIVHKKLLDIAFINPASQWYFAQIILFAIVIFVCGIIIEFLRKKIVHEPFMKLANKIDFSGFDSWINMEDGTK